MAPDPELLSTTEQAAHWWEVFHGDDATASDHREFADWMARSPERVAAYLRVARLHQALRSPSVVWPDTPADELIRDAKVAPADVLPWKRTESVARERPRRAPNFFTRVTLGFAAAILIACGASWVMMSRPQAFQTKFGEQRSILLDDGSRVTLNTASRIEIDLDEDHRLIHLVQGEALFEVAHDATRPFDVKAGANVLRAVGTQFDVDLRPTHTTVTVVEGQVALMSGADRDGRLPTLIAADRLVITAAGPGVTRHGIDVAAAISWTQRQLVFDHRPLGEVADEFNRYNHDRIEIGSARLRAEQITGTFQSNDAASFVSFLSSIPGVRIRADGSGGHIVTLEGSD